MVQLKNKLNHYFRAEDKILLTLLLSVIPLTIAYYFVNANGAQYATHGAMNLRLLALLVTMLAVYIGSLYARDFFPRAGLVTWAYAMFFFLFVVNNIMTSYVKLTPFPPIDFSLVKIDQFLGFYQTAWLNWTYAHPFLQNFLTQCYALLVVELVVAPFVLALLLQRRALRVLFMSLIISFSVGSLIYYFFPTTAPASMFFDPHFTIDQHDTFIKFYQLHHYLPITTREGGLIAFPSFHVVWAALLAYAFRHKKYWFYPIALFNIFVILSTFMLGWHYLTDVIAGLALAGLSILAAELIHKKFIREPRSQP